jgi:hypothetical protein
MLQQEFFCALGRYGFCFWFLFLKLAQYKANIFSLT